MDILDGQASSANSASSANGSKSASHASGSRYILHLDSHKLPASIGNKARNLQVLRDQRLPVPDTFVCTWDAFLAYQQQGVVVLPRPEAGAGKDHQARKILRGALLRQC